MQNADESLYNLISTKTFDELTLQERKEVLCHLTEVEYRNQTAVLQKLDSSIKTPLIEPNLNFKKALDQRLRATSNYKKEAFPFYKIAACFALFMLFTFIYIKIKQNPNLQPTHKPVAQQQKTLEQKTLPNPSIPKNQSIVKVDKPTFKKEIKKNTQVINVETSTNQNEFVKKELTTLSDLNTKLGINVGLNTQTPLCSNPEDTEANDIMAQMLRL